MEYIPCPMCGADDSALVFEGGDLLHPGEETFKLNRCRVCDHYYLNPRPSVEQIGDYYPEDYMPFQSAIEDEQQWWKRLDRRHGRYRRCKPVHQAAGKAGRLLDVGCATGVFMDGMRHFGWEVEGVEPTAYAAAYARERFGFTIFEGRLEDAPYPDSSFDAITLWDVLEHVHEPREVLTHINRLLQPGGLLVMSLPNPDSLEARLLGRYWAGWDLPRHLNLYRPAQLRKHLTQMGFTVNKIRSFTSGYAVLVMSVEHWCKTHGYNAERMGRLLRILPLRLLAKPYYNGPADWFNLSSIMVVFATCEKKINS